MSSSSKASSRPNRSKRFIRKLTETVVGIEAENMRSVTVCVVDEVASGDWAIGRQPSTTEDVLALSRGVPVG